MDDAKRVTTSGIESEPPSRGTIPFDLAFEPAPPRMVVRTTLETTVPPLPRNQMSPAYGTEADPVRSGGGVPEEFPVERRLMAVVRQDVQGPVDPGHGHVEQPPLSSIHVSLPPRIMDTMGGSSCEPGKPYGPDLLFNENTWFACNPLDPWIVMNLMDRSGRPTWVTMMDDLSEMSGVQAKPSPFRTRTSWLYLTRNRSPVWRCHRSTCR